MKRRFTGKRIAYVILGCIAQVSCFFSWLAVGEKRYFAVEYLFRMSGDPVGVYTQDMMGTSVIDAATRDYLSLTAVTTYVVLLLMTVSQALLLVHLLLNLFTRHYASILVAFALLFSGISATLMAVSGAMSGTSGGSWMLAFYPSVIMIATLLVFIGGKMAEEWNEASRQEKEYQIQRKEGKKEKRERLKFDGKYAKEFYQVIWKNFRYHFRDYRLLVGAGLTAVGLLFVSCGMQELMSGMDQSNEFDSGRGIDAVLVNFFGVFTVLAVFLITYILIYYLKNRMKNYSIFITLGIRRKTLRLFIGSELGASVLLSFAGGLIFGNVLLLLFRKIAGIFFKGRVVLGGLTAATYGKTILMSVLVFLLSFLITYGICRETNVIRMKNETAAKEKMAGRFAVAGLLAGIAIAGYFAYRFSKIESAEGVGTILLFLAGVYLILRNGWSIALKQHQKTGKSYYGHLIARNMLYHKFRKSVRYVFLLAVIPVFAFVTFSKDMVSSLIAPEPGVNLPYDYVLLANSNDDETLSKIRELGAEVREYPMVRATTVDRTIWPDDYRMAIIPQGQNIGISESTFYELKALLGEEDVKIPELDADGENIYVVYQQSIEDNAKPLDYYMNRRKPNIFIGQPLSSYTFLYRDELFVSRTIVGSETGSLIGVFREGIHENIVVFSDAHFESVKDNWKWTNKNSGDTMPEDSMWEEFIHEWPTRLVLVQQNDAEQEDMDALLSKFQADHAEDERHDRNVKSYYGREETIQEKEAERLLKEISNGFIVILLLLISIFLLYMKVESELPDMKQRYLFLNHMGMLKKERILCLKKEISRFVCLPLGLAAVVIPIFTVLVFRLRHFTTDQMLQYLKIFGAEFVIYVAVQFVAMKALERYALRKVEG